MVSVEFFSDIILTALGSNQPLTEMSSRCISGGKGGRCVRLTTLQPSCGVVMKSGNLNFLEPSGPLQACNGTALPFIYGVRCQLRDDPKIVVVFLSIIKWYKWYMLQSRNPCWETYGLLSSNFFYPLGLISKYMYCKILQVKPEVHTKIVSRKP